MKISLPIAQFQLNQGGAEMISHRLALKLISRGHEVEIISTRPAGTRSFSVEAGVPVRRFFSCGNRRGIWRLGPYFFTILLYRHLVERRSAYHIVHAQQAFHPAYASILARRRTGRPVIVQLHTAGIFGDLLQMTQGRPTLPVGSSRMLDVILREADALVAISTPIWQELLEFGAKPEKIVKIPNGVEIPPQRSTEEMLRARAELAVDPDTRVVVYAGRSGPQKGSDILVRAWIELSRRQNNAVLYLLGEGFTTDPDFMREASKAGASLVVTGKVSNVELYLRAADLFVLPSRGEGLSLAILEAQSMGIPCLVSDISPNRDLVEDGITGFLCRPEDHRDFLDKLVFALDNPGKACAAGAAARARVQAQFSLDTVAASFENLYARFVK
jgi:glycosyltransferase involved in cell wall biosynthesis